MGKQSVVKHMLAIDWKSWRSYLKSSSAYSMTIQMLGRVAGTLLFVDGFYIIGHCYYMLTTYNYFISLDMNILNLKIDVLVYILLIDFSCTCSIKGVI